ncbi:MAG: HlyD family efflux transporter periplasmic adaptor subunit [Rhizobiales bacterium]|nr:HlyD family efflux transporter periplasmic adaptor subunit [Hyphomicrobiales bacterium]
MTLHAPFRAHVGLTDLQPGAYLDAGASVAMLQGVDPDAFVDFTLPQDMAAAIRPGRTVTLAGAQIPGGHVEAEIVAEDASVDAANRAVRLRAIVRVWATVCVRARLSTWWRPRLCRSQCCWRR